MEDREIIELYLQREESAISESSQKYGRLCQHVADNVLGSKEDAEECVNETWFRSWLKIPPTIPESLKAFFVSITRNLALDRYRALHAEKRFVQMEIMLDELEECIPSGSSVEEVIEASELSGLICRWLDDLQKEDRVTFVKRYYYGVSVKELAAARALSENTMAVKLARLRADLKTKLQKEWNEI